MSEAPERIWDFWPHDGGSPVLWREPCPFPAEDAEVFEYVRADRIEELEAKLSESEALLAKAVEALEFYATQDVTYPNVGTVTFHGHDDNGCKARATLAELTGGKDE